MTKGRFSKSNQPKNRYKPKKAKPKKSNKPKTLLVAMSVRKVLKDQGLNTSDNFIFCLNSHIESTIERAAYRAESNNRKTVRGNDL